MQLPMQSAVRSSQPACIGHSEGCIICTLQCLTIPNIQSSSAHLEVPLFPVVNTGSGLAVSSQSAPGFSRIGKYPENSTCLFSYLPWSFTLSSPNLPSLLGSILLYKNQCMPSTSMGPSYLLSYPSLTLPYTDSCLPWVHFTLLQIVRLSVHTHTHMHAPTPTHTHTRCTANIPLIK